MIWQRTSDVAISGYSTLLMSPKQDTQFKKQNMFNEIWSISSSPSVEWSPATTGRVDADILNGSCDVWGSRDFLPYILYNLL